MKFDDLTHCGDKAPHHPRKVAAPAPGAQSSLMPTGLVDQPSPLLTTRNAAQLQRAVGNLTTSALITQRELDGGIVDRVGVSVQRTRDRVQPDPLVGRRKRRQIAQQEELAEMDKANADWEARQEEDEADPTHNPFDVLAELTDPEKPTPKPDEPTPKPQQMQEPAPVATLDTYQAAGDDLDKLRMIRVDGCSEKLLQEMRRLWRTSNITTGTRGFGDIDKLRGQALAKMDAREYSPVTSSGTAALNSKGGPVAGLTKGIKSGFLAGAGATWHVHYDHVKYGSRNDTRVNFAGRTQTAILAQLQTVSASVPDRTNFQICQNWIRANY